MPKFPVKGYVNNYWIDEKGTIRKIRTNKLMRMQTKYNAAGYKFYDNTFHRVVDLWAENGFIEKKDNEYIIFKDGDKYNIDLENLDIGLIKDREDYVSEKVGDLVKMVNDDFFISHTGILYEFTDDTIKNIIKPTLNKHNNTLVFNYHFEGFPICREADRLVAEYWVLKPDDGSGYEVLHKDGDYNNIDATNLAWGNYYTEYDNYTYNPNEVIVTRIVDRNKLNLKNKIVL